MKGGGDGIKRRSIEGESEVLSPMGGDTNILWTRVEIILYISGDVTLGTKTDNHGR